MYCDSALNAPGAAIGWNAVHDPSGVGVLPVRTEMAMLVPGGVVPVQYTLCQFT